MKNKIFIIILAALVIIPIAFIGCKARSREVSETTMMEPQDPGAPIPGEQVQMVEPSQTVATETIPPTAAPALESKPAAIPQFDRSREIQRALKNAGFYAGAVDGKIGPKTKKAIEDFQKAHGLKVDGKVGQKTWAELEKFLIQQ